MKTKLALIITLAGCFLCGNILAVPPLPGAIFTTDSTCSGVDLNIYANKGDVYLNGGPAHPGGQHLPDGSYYVRVTDPSGSLLLGTSIGSGNDTPFVVSGGVVQGCYQLCSILISGGNQTKGVGQTATFASSTTGGTPPFSYQWNKNGNPISSLINNTATNATLVLASASPSDIAQYSVTVQNFAGSVLSSNATLTVNSVMTNLSLTPANGAIGVCYDTPLTIVFSQPPLLGSE